MADSPKEAEAAQALFCAIVDVTNKPIPLSYKTYAQYKIENKDDINRAIKITETPGVSLSQIEKFLEKDSDWFTSSVNIANKLLEKTEKIAKITARKISSSTSDLFYVRGDDDIFGGIEKLWKYTNETTKKRNEKEGTNSLVFNNINKWSPADIYLASKKSKDIIPKLSRGQDIEPYACGKLKIKNINMFVDFSILNMFIRQLTEDGELLPLSLKKSPDYDKTVIKTINFIENDVQDYLKQHNIGYHGYIFSKTKDVFNSKDVYIKFTSKGTNLLQFRDKGSSGQSKGKAPVYSYQGIITGGAQALDGGLAGQSIGDVLISTDSSAGRKFSLSNQKKIIDTAVSISKDMDREWNKDGKLKTSINNEICKGVYKFVNKYSGVRFSNIEEFYQALYSNPSYNHKMKSSKLPNESASVRARAQFLFGKYLGGSMIEIFESNQKMADEMVTNMILYAGSRSKSSSPHWKASDISSF